jgi:hypothetical protein
LRTESGEHLKPRSQYADEAVQLAIEGRWEDAFQLNQTIIEKFGPDEESQNRLGKALTELGRLELAKAAYEACLAINPMNTIARKNLAKLETLLQGKEGIKAGPARVDLNLFVEEMGKTIVTNLDAVEDPEVCSKVAAGDLADLRLVADGIIAEDMRGVRLGLVEPKLARRLTKFIQGGNRYQAGITSCEGSIVKMIIRETYQDPKFAGKPSFPVRRKREVDFRPYTKENLIQRDGASFGDDDGDADEGGTRSEDELDEGMHTVEDEAEPLEDFSDDADEVEAEEEDEDSDE